VRRDFASEAMVQLSAAFASLQAVALLPWDELLVFLGKYALAVFILRVSLLVNSK
jgi:hypothetical protein